jgi:hypothetical protein
MALLATDGDRDDASSSPVFWAIAALIVVFVVVAVLVGLMRLL